MGVITVYRPVKAAQTDQTAQAAHRRIDAGVACCQLRQAVIGRHDGRRHILQGLPAQTAQGGGEVTPAPVQTDIVDQQALGQRRPADRKITPVIIVTDPIQVGVEPQRADGRQATVNTARVLQGIGPAIDIAQLVARHQAGYQLARITGLQIAVLSPQIEAAFGHDRGRECRVPVGCDVKVIGLGKQGATGAVQAKRRWQETRLSLVAERKAQGRNCQDGHALEAQDGVGRLAGLCFLVKFETGAGEHPGRLPCCLVIPLTGGKSGIVGHQALVIDKVNARCLTVAATGQKPVAWLGKKTFEGIELDLQGRSPVLVTRTADTHIASGFDCVFGLVVFDAVCANGRRPASQFSVTVDHDLQVRAARQAVAKNENRYLVAWPFGWFLGQHGCCFYRQWRTHIGQYSDVW